MYKYRYNKYMKPKFKHDCTHCKFLGHGTYLDTPVDWYVCQGRFGYFPLAYEKYNKKIGII